MSLQYVYRADFVLPKNEKGHRAIGARPSRTRSNLPHSAESISLRKGSSQGLNAQGAPGKSFVAHDSFKSRIEIESRV